jgi:hypothetical protein
MIVSIECRPTIPQFPRLSRIIVVDDFATVSENAQAPAL